MMDTVRTKLAGRTPIWAQSVIAAVAAAAVAATGAALTRLGPWYYGLKKPSFQPPDWLFGPAWTTIFICCAIAGVWAWRRAQSTRQRLLIIVLFALNAVMNVTWSMLFFYLHRPDWALLQVGFLWFSIFALMVFFWRWARHSSWLLAPYLVWVSFASVLNVAIVSLNAPFVGRT